MNERYEGGYKCMSSEPDDSCPNVATQVWREPYTPASFRVLLCDEHVEHARGFGYRFDQEATIQLCRDIERQSRGVLV